MAAALPVHDLVRLLLNANGERAAHPAMWRGATNVIGKMCSQNTQTHQAALRFFLNQPEGQIPTTGVVTSK